MLRGLRLGIVVAMDEEYSYYDKHLKELNYDKQIKKIGKFKFDIYEKMKYMESYNEHEVNEIVIVKSFIGKTNSAIATTVLISFFNVDLIINTGSSGAINDKLDIGDTLIGTSYKYCDVDATVFGYKKGQVPQMPILYGTDIRLYYSAVEAYMKLYKDKEVIEGCIGTTDSFISDKSIVSEYNVDCVDMEATSIAQTCYQFDIQFIAIKSMSDKSDGTSPDDFESFVKEAGKRTTNLVVEMIKLLNDKDYNRGGLVNID